MFGAYNSSSLGNVMVINCAMKTLASLGGQRVGGGMRWPEGPKIFGFPAFERSGSCGTAVHGREKIGVARFGHHISG